MGATYLALDSDALLWLSRRAWGVLMLGEPLGKVPCPPILDTAASRLAAVLSSDTFPVHLNSMDLSDLALSRALIVITLAPLIWNLVGRLEFHSRIISGIVGRYVGAYALALWIFSFSLYRDFLFIAAIEAQPRVPEMGDPTFVIPASIVYILGAVLVLTSMFRLGITGTYLGDYFGILMDAKVEAFPYSMFRHPMYDGASLCFLGKAILEESPAGILLSAWAYIVYQLALAFEEPFTLHIYAQRDTPTRTLNRKKRN